MKGLLQSKRFRKNLSKWLCMYVGAILLLTTVITYSKYISSFGFDDKARVTKFNVEVKNVTTNVVNDSSDAVNIETGALTPGDEMTYDFNIDYEFEVTTNFVLIIDVDSNFEVVSILENGVDIKTSDSNRMQKSEVIPAASNNITKKYSVTVKYKEDSKVQGNTEIVKVYYKAQQVD